MCVGFMMARNNKSYIPSNLSFDHAQAVKVVQNEISWQTFRHNERGTERVNTVLIKFHRPYLPNFIILNDADARAGIHVVCLCLFVYIAST